MTKRSSQPPPFCETTRKQVVELRSIVGDDELRNKETRHMAGSLGLMNVAGMTAAAYLTLVEYVLNTPQVTA
jgi:hypothetical protein